MTAVEEAPASNADLDGGISRVLRERKLTIDAVSASRLNRHLTGSAMSHPRGQYVSLTVAEFELAPVPCVDVIVN
jgi:hypothetical protein